MEQVDIYKVKYTEKYIILDWFKNFVKWWMTFI
jgi:hypothetical protein